jgi:tetratricopeptide (TPR) repeat protein
MTPRLLVALALLAAAPAPAAERLFELNGNLVPAGVAAVTLYGATTPFSATTHSDLGGKFRFRNLAAGSYTLAVFEPKRGETRLTIVIGPSVADKKGRVVVAVRLDESKLNREAAHAVSARALAVPEAAKREYAQAERKLTARDIAGAIAHLERAVEIAPGYASAWNHLGTIAYQTRDYPAAERHFRRALEADPNAYEPLVNLGGVLLNLGQPEEAWQHNLSAVLRRPTDALANSQMGMTYMALDKPALAEKYLTEAVRLDPAHFSRPQLLLAEIFHRRGDFQAAARALEDLLARHPDAPEAPQIRAMIDKLRAPR